MSIKLMNLAWEMELPLGQKMVLMALADRSNSDGECWPGQASLAKMCSLSERALRDNLERLEKQGLLTVISRRVNGRQGTAIYHLHLQSQPADSAACKSSSQPADDDIPSRQMTTSQPADDDISYKEQPTIKQPTYKQPSTAPSNARMPEQILWDHTRSMFTGISEEQMDEWELAFPKLDIDGELTRIELWYQLNPKKHKRAITRFITNWLARTFKDLRTPRVFIAKQPPSARPP